MEPTKEQEKEWINNNKYWKWGVFYYNPDDKRLFLPKRNPSYGITINFANKNSILFFILFFSFFGTILYAILISKTT